MSWTRPGPGEYTPETNLGGKLIAPAPGTIYFRIAQLETDEPSELFSIEDARDAIDAGRAPNTSGKVPNRFLDKVADYAEQSHG